MFMTKTLNRLRPPKKFVYALQTCVSERMKSSKSDSKKLNSKQAASQTLGEIGSKYQVFHEEHSEIILDIYEERQKHPSLLEIEDEENPLEGINLERGLEGVYDIEDLVDVLRRENAQDIFVATVPKEIKYVNHICVATGKSYKHMQAITQFIRKIYKKKMHKTDHIPKLEGGDSKDWMALDLGNIALHIFSPGARILYDIESLWSVGPQYDTECNKQDPVTEILEKHTLYLKDLHPAG